MRDTVDFFLQTHAHFSWLHLTLAALKSSSLGSRVQPESIFHHYGLVFVTRGYQFTVVANLDCELARIGMHTMGCLRRRVHRRWVWAAPSRRLGVETQLEGGRGRNLESVRIISFCSPAGEQGSSTPLSPHHHKTSAAVSTTYPALTTWFLGVPLP